MKLRIEVTDNLTEDEVVIRCGRVDETVRKIEQFILQETSQAANFTFYKQNQEYYFSLDSILFFETDGEHVYAHTASDAYRIKFRLYELESILPRYFVRAAKSTIVNIKHVFSIERNITSSSLVQFNNSHKQVFLSRNYYSELRQRLNERSNYEK